MTNPKTILNSDGSAAMEAWEDDKGRNHRDNGLPAVVVDDGYESYWVHGVLMAIRDEEGILQVFANKAQDTV